MPRRSNNEPLTDEQSALAAANLGLVFNVIGDLFRHSPAVRRFGFDQALSEGFLTLVRCARGYDPGKSHNTKGFAAYACRAVRTEVSRAAGRWGRLACLPDAHKVRPQTPKLRHPLYRRHLRGLYDQGWLVHSRQLR